MYTKLTSFFEKNVAYQKLELRRNCLAKGDVGQYLQTINSYEPKSSQGKIKGRGLLFDVAFPDNGLRSQIVISNSFHMENGLYLNTIYEFSPNQYSFNEALNIAKEKYDLMLDDFNLTIEEMN